MVSQLKKGEYHPYYGSYISKAVYPDIVEGLQHSKIEFINFVTAIAENKLTHAYAKEKWTIAEVLMHLIDAERIFAYRALRFARKDKTSLSGFEQDDYVPNSNANNYSKEELIADFEAARNNSIALFESFSNEMLTAIGEASGSPMSTRAIGYLLVGHQKHHFTVIEEKYI